MIQANKKIQFQEGQFNKICSLKIRPMVKIIKKQNDRIPIELSLTEPKRSSFEAEKRFKILRDLSN